MKLIFMNKIDDYQKKNDGASRMFFWMFESYPRVSINYRNRRDKNDNCIIHGNAD